MAKVSVPQNKQTENNIWKRIYPNYNFPNPRDISIDCRKMEHLLEGQTKAPKGYWFANSSKIVKIILDAQNAIHITQVSL